MKKRFGLTPIIVLAALILMVGMFALYNNSSLVQAHTTHTIHVVEHAITDTEVPAKDALGNQLVFHNPIFDAANKKQVGQDNGNCVRTIVGKEWECFWTIFLPAGQITVEGPFYDNGADSLLAITGGTGSYQTVRGQMKLHARGNPVGSEYDFIYMLAS